MCGNMYIVFTCEGTTTGTGYMYEKVVRVVHVF